MAETTQEKGNPYLTALAVLLPAFLALAGTSATNVSQAHIAGFYGATQYEANTVVTCYMIAGGLMIPLTGYLVRTIGARNLMNYSLITFIIACIGCVISPNLQILILARVLQGVGHGCILPLAQAILLDVFPGKKRGIAMGLFGIAAIFSPLIGPYIGGYLTDNYSWQWIFIMNIPFCLLSLLLFKLFFKGGEKPEGNNRKSFDVVGYVALVIAMSCMQIVLDKGQQFNWFDEPWICVVSAICIFSFVFFYVWELEFKNPFVDVRVFKDRNFLLGTIISSFINVVLYSTLLLVPNFVQGLLGYSPYMSGLTMFPRAVVCLLGLLFAGEITKYINPKPLSATGFGIIVISLLMLTQMNPESSMSSIILPNILLCIGVPIAFVPVTALAFCTLPKEKTADATGLHALFKNIVTAIATALAATFIARVSQVRQTYLVGSLSGANHVFFGKLAILKAKFGYIYPSVVASKKAMGMMYKQLLYQAKLAAFFDAFAFLALLIICIIPLIFLLKRPKN